MMRITGAWGLLDLESVLGPSKNNGVIEHRPEVGGPGNLVQQYGPFSFENCSCVAVKGGASGDLYLTPCSDSHAALKPKWTI